MLGDGDRMPIPAQDPENVLPPRSIHEAAVDENDGCHDELLSARDIAHSIGGGKLQCKPRPARLSPR